MSASEQAALVYKLIEEKATGPVRRDLRTHSEEWLRLIFQGWENGEHWSHVDVGTVRWNDAEAELLVLIEWYEQHPVA